MNRRSRVHFGPATLRANVKVKLLLLFFETIFHVLAAKVFHRIRHGNSFMVGDAKSSAAACSLQKKIDRIAAAFDVDDQRRRRRGRIALWQRRFADAWRTQQHRVFTGDNSIECVISLGI
jgi:hypothetical protein